MTASRCLVASLLAFVVAAVSTPADSGAAPVRAPLASFEHYIEQARLELGNVGVAVAVVQGDRVIFAQGFGVKEYGKSGKVGPDTLFQIGSTTKAFTGATVGILVDEGKLRWDDAVVSHLPSFQLQDPWLTRQLTLRDTLSHRSGIAESPYYVFAVMDAQAAMEQLRYIRPQYAFRDSYNYSNLMYGVAGQVVSAVSGMSWNEFVRRRLLQPLRMTRSGASPYEFWAPQYVAPTFQGSAVAARFSAADARDADVAMPHIVDEKKQPRMIAWQSYDNAAAAGSIVSSARDMANWVIMNLNEGRFEGRQVLKPETVEEMHATQNLRDDGGRYPFQGLTEGYAMGWQRARFHDLTILSHGGGIIGFPAYVALMPQRKIGVVVLANSEQAVAGDTQAFRKAIALRALDRLLQVSPRDWSQEFLARARQTASQSGKEEEALQKGRLRDAPPSLPLEQYAGDYEDRELHSGRVTVRVEEDRLTLRFAGEGAFAASLEPWHHELFRLHKIGAPGWGQFVNFVIGPKGQVTSMSLFDGTFDRLPSQGKP